jgi:hypothetical protein
MFVVLSWESKTLEVNAICVKIRGTTENLKGERRTILCPE